MATTDFRFDDIGVDVDFSAPTSGSTPVKVLGANSPTKGRKGVNVSNNSSYGMRVKVSTSDTAPTISSTSKHVRIPPNDNRVITGGGTIRIWVLSEDASNAAAGTATELL